MDRHQGNGVTGENVLKIKFKNSGNGNQNLAQRSSDQAVWTTEDGIWNRDASVDITTNSNHGERHLLGCDPLNKGSQNSLLGDDKSKVSGKIFCKTKLCCEFRVGTSPYVTDCNLVHGIEELTEPSPDWLEIEDAHKEEQVALLEPREEFQIPVLQTSEERRELYRVKRCRNFYSEEGCSFGMKCNFLHDAQSEFRETVAICLVPSTSGGCGSGSIKSASDPSNWKTRMCRNWELNGFCPHGSNCHFAHGPAELRPNGTRLAAIEVKDSSSLDTEQGAVPAKTSAATATSVPCTFRVPPPRLLHVNNQNTGKRPLKWKGPDKISKIYGDWIDDL